MTTNLTTQTHTAATKAVQDHLCPAHADSKCICGWNGRAEDYPAHVADAVLQAVDDTTPSSWRRPDKEPVDLRGFGELVGVGLQTLRTYRKDGRLPPPDGRIGKTDWWYPATVQQWQKARPYSSRRQPTPTVAKRAVAQPETRDPGTRYTHDTGRVCVLQRSGAWGIYSDATLPENPAKGFCALAHPASGDDPAR